MAKIGLSKPYFAKYNNEGNVVTYTEGALIGKAVKLNLELEGAESNILFADNGPAESDNQFAGGTITLVTDDLRPEAMFSVLGVKKEAIEADGVTTEGAEWIVFDDTQEIPYGGLGGVIKKKVDGSIKWVAIVFTKIQFTNPGEAVTTQGETIEWQTSELSANVMRDDTDTHVWRRISSFLSTEAEAEAAVKSILGAASQPTEEPENGGV